jgi:hypothetical protein
MIMGLVLLFSLALGTMASAEEKKEKGKHETGDQMQEKAKPGAVVKKFAGKVVSFDMATKTLIVKREKTEKTFDVSGAKLASNTKLEEIKADDKVAIKYIEKDGKNLATAIVRSPRKEKKYNDGP